MPRGDRPARGGARRWRRGRTLRGFSALGLGAAGVALDGARDAALGLVGALSVAPAGRQPQFEQIAVGPLTLQGFAAAIEEPARVAELTLEPGLAAEMVADTGTEDALPLLAFTLRRYQIEQVASDLKNILEQLAISKVHILGYSMGGRLALTFASLYPQCVRSLLLESTSPGLETEEERMERRKQDQQLANRILTNGMEAFVELWENISLFESQKKLSLRNKGAYSSAASCSFSFRSCK